jgi:hypothetical protein
MLRRLTDQSGYGGPLNTTCNRPARRRRTARSEHGPALEYQDREASATPSWLRPATELAGDPLTTRQRRFVPTGSMRQGRWASRCRRRSFRKSAHPLKIFNALGDAGPKTRVHVRLIVVVSATNSIDSAEGTQTKGMMTFSRAERVRG